MNPSGTPIVTGPIAPPPNVPTTGSYAVVDLETTGLAPDRGDRVIEIAVVITDGHGRIDYEWTTLVDPTHDPGPTHLHGIDSGMVEDAPVFGQIADDLAHVLRGRTLVAHNSRFDVSFLRAEWNRLGQNMSPPSFCTMTAARSAGLRGGLSACCGQLGIDVGVQHHALDDARATAHLLARLGPSTDRRPAPVRVTWRLPPWSGRGLHHRVAVDHSSGVHQPG